VSENTQRPDLKINGSGTAAGGDYGLIRINGSGRVTGDLTCDDFIINGSGEASGRVESQTLKVNGSGRVADDLSSKEVKINGSANLGGEVSCETFSVSGTADVKKGLKAHKVNINGSVKIEGDLSADEFTSNGLFEINGLLNADNIEVRLYWHKSRAREIGGEKISVGLGKGGLGVIKTLFTGIHYPSLVADSIEGNDISLENTTAKVVRGNNITIGAGCEIGLVEYKGTFHKAGGAKVAEERKI